MSGIYEIFGDTPIGTTGGTLIVYGTCLVFLFMLLKEGMIRNVLSDGFSWVVVYGLLAVVHRLHCLTDRLFDTFTVKQKRQAGRGGLYPASGAFDKPRLQKLLKLTHLQADGGL